MVSSFNDIHLSLRWLREIRIAGFFFKSERSVEVLFLSVKVLIVGDKNILLESQELTL